MEYQELDNLQLNEYNYNTDKSVDFINGVAGINNADSNTKKLKSIFAKIATWLRLKAPLESPEFTGTVKVNDVLECKKIIIKSPNGEAQAILEIGEDGRLSIK